VTRDWESVNLGEVLTHRKEFIEIDDSKSYKRCRVQLHAKGIVLRDIVQGVEIKTKRQQVCKPGEFLVAEIDAKLGGFGIVPEELEDAIVSSHYFLFEVNESRLERRFLHWYSKTESFKDQVNAQGSTNYAAIRPRDVLGYTIPLPPLEEQRRIVARVEAMTARIEEARGLRISTEAEREMTYYAMLKSIREKLVRTFQSQQLGSITKVTAGGTPSRGNPDYWGGNVPWFKTGELKDGDLYDAEESITERGVSESSAKRFPVDTILVALYGQGQTRGRTGRLMLSATTNQACCAILPVPEQLQPRFTQFWIQSLYKDLREQAHGGAQPNWNSGQIKELLIAVPPLHAQTRVLEEVDKFKRKLLQLEQLQNASRLELDALLPSILAKAFAGEL
jgi:type I restriction enzyme, S subunit